jgi:hypothetical protein
MSRVRPVRIVAACLLPVFALGCDGLKKSGGSAGGGEPDLDVLSPDQIADHIDAGFLPIYAVVDGITAETKVPAELRKSMTEHVENSMKEFRSNPDATRGFRRASYRLEDRLRECREAQNADSVLLMCDLIKMLNPGNERLGSFTKWAHDLKNRPEVIIRGWYEDLAANEETIYVFLDVTLPGDNEVHAVRARKGDTFFDLEFLDIIGDRSGILLKYTKTADIFEVYGRSWEIKQKLQDSLGDAL